MFFVSLRAFFFAFFFFFNANTGTNNAPKSSFRLDVEEGGGLTFRRDGPFCVAERSEASPGQRKRETPFEVCTHSLGATRGGAVGVFAMLL